MLHYLRDNTDEFVEQTKCYTSDSIKQTKLKDCLDFIIRKRKFFFIFEDWYKYAQSCDFCIGGRFHGNVVCVLAGVPALFLTEDSRTSEMTDFYELPTLSIKDFDASKPLEYYYELTDYSNFNKNYAKKLDNFIDFCLVNNLEMNYGSQQFFYRKLTDKT